MENGIPKSIPVRWGAGYQHILPSGKPIHHMNGEFYVREGEDFAAKVAEFFNPTRTRRVGRRTVDAWDAMDRRILERGELYIYSEFPRSA